ncbi:MAG: NAD(P)H-hydrate epimerase, partial [Candidatus Cloacimonetes bacterium]|nr:NAD(P)H-hydrate epimerase [Candidatus Cloacimonadota bacterium]
MKVLSPVQMYALDKKTMEEFGIPSRVLMETAGKGCADYIQNHFLSDDTPMEISVFCGSGNNGGDGFVIARWLHFFGHKVTVFLLNELTKSSEETKVNHDLVAKLDIPIITISDEESWQNGRLPFIKSSLVIDAIFGIGFKGDLTCHYSTIVNSINRSKKQIISIDIPSGLNSETGQTKLAVKADYTLTMAALKYGHLVGEGRKYSGETVVIPIGIPQSYFDEIGESELMDEQSVKLPVRSKFSHKGTYG